MFCTANCKKWTTFTVSAVFLVLGLALAIGWKAIEKKLLNYEFSLKNRHTEGYKMWKQSPVPIYMEFHMFNWTNAEEYSEDTSIKPKFEEFGPYVFKEIHTRRNVTINDHNATVTFYTEKVWHFDEEKTNSSLSLDDYITTLNPIVAVVGGIAKWKHFLVREGVNFLLKEKKEKLFVTKKVREFLFDGYDDPLLDLLNKLNTTFKIPFKKFGWFSERNNSYTADGALNFNSGTDDINKLGIINSWNFEPNISFYHGSCAAINGTTGELWYPVHEAKTVKIFIADVCSTLELDYMNDMEHYGVKGRRYELGIRNFDNGTKYPESKCYVPDGITEQLSGIRNVSKCKFDAPAFVSFAHFMDADPAFREAIEGMHPDPEKHKMYLGLEPETGVPLDLGAAIQLSLLMEPVEGLDVLANVTRIFMPAFWFKESVELPENLAHLVKIVLVLPEVGQYTGIGFISFGVLILTIGVVITVRKGWSNESEDTQILTQNSL